MGNNKNNIFSRLGVKKQKLKDTNKSRKKCCQVGVMQATYLAMERMSKDKGGKVSFHFCMKWSMVVNNH